MLENDLSMRIIRLDQVIIIHANWSSCVNIQYSFQTPSRQNDASVKLAQGYLKLENEFVYQLLSRSKHFEIILFWRFRHLEVSDLI